jgi:hypothetical protein
MKKCFGTAGKINLQTIRHSNSLDKIGVTDIGFKSLKAVG